MWLFDLLNPDNYLACSFKINLDCTFYLFSVTVFIFFHIFHSSENRWQKTEACPRSLCFFRQAMAYFVRNKGTSGLQNFSDTLSWWFIKTTHWKQSILSRRGRWTMCFYVSHVAWLTLSFILTWSQSLRCSLLFPGRVTTSQINKAKILWHPGILQTSWSHSSSAIWLFELAPSTYFCSVFWLFSFCLLAKLHQHPEHGRTNKWHVFQVKMK